LFGITPFKAPKDKINYKFGVHAPLDTPGYVYAGPDYGNFVPPLCLLSL